MNYESFHPIDKYPEKPNSNILKRFFTKINNPAPEKINVVNQTIPKLIKNEISVSAENLNKEKLNKEKTKQNSKEIYLSKRHSADCVQDKMSLTKLLKTVKVNIQSTLLENPERSSSIERIDRGYWMPDSICRKCYSCEEEFTTIKRKHHCRMCGQIFCYRCCIEELPGSLWNLSKPQRSCKMCFISYYSQHGTKVLSPREGRSIRNSVHSRSSKSNVSPHGSIASETVVCEESNLPTINKNLSFSSNDIQYLKDPGDSDYEYEIEDDDSKKNLSEIERVSSDFKNKNPDRKQSIYKTFFPSHILSRDKLFGSKISGITNISNINEFGSDQDKYKQELLSIWKLIIKETEKCRRNYFTNIKVQKQTRQIEQRFSFPNSEDDSFLPIIFKEQDSSKSCIGGNFLIDWITRNSEISDVSRATAICQSYLEMQLLSPYFDQDNKKQFKYDATLYVIREFTADCSPQVKCSNQFFNDTDRGYNNVKKNCGNSVFYVDYDDIGSIMDSNQGDESLQRNPITTFLKIKSPTVLRAAFENNTDDVNLEDSIFQKNDTIIWNRSCRYLERLLKQELHDYNLDISWCNIILPICKMLSEKICPIEIGDRLISDIRNFVQIKKIPNSSKNDCRVYYSVSMSKNIDYPMKKEVKNPKVILIRSSIDYWRHRKLVSFDPLLLQEEEYLKNCVIKIKHLEPDIVVVEGSVALSAKEMMENCGLLLVSNVRKEQIERLSRMLGATIFDSVDSLGTSVESVLGKCIQFSVQKYTLTNGRNKTLLFFKLFNPKHGCTILLHGKSLSELVRVKYVTKFILLAFKNAYFELALLKNFQIRLLPLKSPTPLDSSNKSNEKIPDSSKSNLTTPSTFMEIIENRCIAMSVNVIYDSPKAVVRSISNPELQNRLLSLEIINLSWKEKLNDVIKRKQRHICAELYDVARMNIRKHPLMYEPQFHAFTNSFYNKDLNNKEQCILYTDFRKNGSRFHPVNDDIENSIISTVNFDSSDLACELGFLTKSQEIKWRTSEKKKFESIYDSFNPRNYQRILMLYSVQTKVGICEKPRKISLNYYETTDRTLGNFVSSMLNDVTTCPIKCDLSIFDHIYKFVSSSGCIQVSLHFLENESHSRLMKSISLQNDSSGIKLWSWCSRCDKLLNLQSMSDETCHLSLGRFFDILVNLNLSDITFAPGQCMHSLQTDIHYYFTQNSVNKALEIKYVPITTYEFQTPFLFLNSVQNPRSLETLMDTFKKLKKEIDDVHEAKIKYNLEIKEKLCELKSKSKDDNELCDFLTKESNSPQYSQKVNDLYNTMETIYSNNSKFDVDLFCKNENSIKDFLVVLWTDIYHFASKWDEKLSDAFEREEKNDKRLSKNDSKNIKSSNDNLMEQSLPIKLEKNLSGELKDLHEKLALPSNAMSNSNSRSPVIMESYEDFSNTGSYCQNNDVSHQLVTISRTSTEISFENIDEAEYSSYKKEKPAMVKETDFRQGVQSERQSNTNTIQPIKKFFIGLFNSVGYKILETRIPQNISYSFVNIETVKIPVIVSDEFITSVVAFALSSDVYLEMLSDYSKLFTTRDCEKFETNRKNSTNQISKLNQDSTNVDSFNISAGSPILKVDKERINKIESITKDKEFSVKYYHHSEPDDLSDFADQELVKEEPKSESEDIKFEVSIEDNLTDDPGQKVFVNKPISKSPVNPDFIINLNNNKVKCACKIYYAKEFHELRQMIFQNDDINFIRSLCECKDWVTTGGKSGLHFRKTLDDRFIVKQVSVIELDGFKKFHRKYFDYLFDRLKNKEKCVLAKILGVYQVDYYNSLTKVSNKMEFIVMENVFYNQKPTRIFDLKGNRQNATNMQSEKINLSDESVMRDKDFIAFCRINPLYVSWQAQIALKETLIRDTDFLVSLPVMDYSLLVGINDSNQVLIIGIIDYLRMFTMNKLIEMHFKQKLMVPHGELPTIIQPQRYQKRFLEAMEEYFLICPIPWDFLLLYPSNSNCNLNSNKKQNFSFEFSSIYPNKPPKSLPLKRSFEKYSDENKLRLGLLSTI